MRLSSECVGLGYNKEFDRVIILVERERPDVVDPTTKFTTPDATNSTLSISWSRSETPVLLVNDWSSGPRSDEFSSGTADVTIAELHMIV